MEEENPKKKPLVRPIRTYKDDVANLVKNQKVSTAKIVLAEQQKRQASGEYQDSEEEKEKSPVPKIIISFLLIILGFGALFFAFQYNLLPEKVSERIKKMVNQNEETKLLREESTTKIYIGIKNASEIRNELIETIKKTDTSKLNGITKIEILKREKMEDGQEVETEIETQNFFNILSSRTPNRLIRSLNSQFFLGVYHDSNPSPFLIFQTDELDLTFSQTFTWEETMYFDLQEVLDLRKNQQEIFIETSTSTEDIISSTSSTSTPDITEVTPSFETNNFVDLVILNKDVRAIVDDQGEIVLMYSFIDNKNLLIVKNKKIFSEIINRISNQTLLR